MKLLEALKANPFVLAPMAGITDHAFRSFMKEMGAGVVVTELISSTGIEYSSQRTLDLMSFDEGQRPVGIQLFGENPDHLARAAQLVEKMGADFVDLNFGCPVPKVVKKGGGSAMLKDLKLMQTVLRSTVGAVKIPVTIKIRTGWDSHTRNADEVTQLAFDEGITWVAIHGRTRAQGYDGLADWDFIAEVKSKAKLPILGNGDILTAAQAVERLNTTKVDGVLIGRGALKNPYIFKEALQLWQLQAEQHQSKAAKDFNELFQRLSFHLMSRCDDRITQIQLKKFAAWFSTGYPGAAQLRKKIYSSNSTQEVQGIAQDFFLGIKHLEQMDTSQDGFLLGGHG